MSDLGRFLKETRKEKDISLDKIQEMTKIRKRYLEAIEEGDFSVLPGHFYARAFIKSYSEALGINAEEVLEQFADELPQVPKAPIETSVSKRRRVRTSSPKIGRWVSVFVFYSFILLVGFVVYLAIVNYMGGDENQTIEPNTEESGAVGEGDFEETDGDSKSGEVDQPSDPEPNPEPEQQDPAPKQEPTFVKLGSTSESTTYEYANAAKMEVTLQANGGPVWFSLSIPDTQKTIAQETLANGNQKSWDLSAYQTIKLRVGDSKVMTLLMNGEAVDTSEIPQGHNIIIQYQASQSE